MADFHPGIDDKLKEFIAAQVVFFVATAPQDNRINISPKGLDCLRVLGPNRVGYLDMTGSGNETAAHLLDDGRITFMFNSFSRKALILRLYGEGRAVLPGCAEFDALVPEFSVRHGTRQLIIADITSVYTSCGYGVPEMELKRERPAMQKWADAKSPQDLNDYQRQKNTVSIDGLPTGLYDRD